MQVTNNSFLNYICILCLTLLINPPEIFSQETTADQLTYITEDYRPYSFEENGELKGLAVDLLRLMWLEMGYLNQPINLYPWARGYKIVQNKPNTVLFAMSRTQARENMFKWVCSINLNRHVLISKKERKLKIRTIEDAKKVFDRYGA